MKTYFTILSLGFLFLSFGNPSHEPMYKMSIEGLACHFDIAINDEFAYTNKHSYKILRTINIGKFLEKKDSQKIAYAIFPMTHKIMLSEKTKLDVYITKEWKGKIDTLHRFDFKNVPLNHEEKIIYSAMSSQIRHFKIP